MSTYSKHNYLDDDEYRIEAGMKRVAYDADTQRYTFQQGNSLWRGEPGNYYGGKLTYIGGASASRSVSSAPYWPGSTHEATDEQFMMSDESGSDQYRSPTSPLKDFSELGAAVTSISATSAKPPDGEGNKIMRRSNTIFKKAVGSTTTALKVTRKWSMARRKNQGNDPNIEGDSEEAEKVSFTSEIEK